MTIILIYPDLKTSSQLWRKQAWFGFCFNVCFLPYCTHLVQEALLSEETILQATDLPTLQLRTEGWNSESWNTTAFGGKKSTFFIWTIPFFSYEVVMYFTMPLSVWIKLRSSNLGSPPPPITHSLSLVVHQVSKTCQALPKLVCIQRHFLKISRWNKKMLCSMNLI
jgi:hypothetical protein